METLTSYTNIMLVCYSVCRLPTALPRSGSANHFATACLLAHLQLRNGRDNVNDKGS